MVTVAPRYELIHRAVQALAGVCDWAEAKDDQGYAASDTAYGHMLAYLPLDAWGPAHTRKAWEMLRKYRRQLAGFGIDYDTLPVPPQVEGDTAKMVAPASDHSGFALFAPYSSGLGAHLRGTIPCAYFRRSPTNHFAIPPVRGVGARLLAFAAKNDVPLAEGTKERAALIDAEAPHVILHEADGRRFFACLFLPNTEWNTQIKRVPHLISIYEPFFRWMAPTTPDAAHVLLQVMADLGMAPSAEAFALLAELEAQYVESGAKAPSPYRIEEIKGGVRVSFPYSPEEVARFKRHFSGGERVLPGVTFNRDHKCWEVAETPTTVMPLLNFLKDAKTATLGYKVDDAFTRRLEGMIADFKSREEKSRARDATLTVPGLARDPYPFQKAGIAYAVETERCMIADEPGCGKTIQAIGAAHYRNAYPVVIVCPASLKLNWEREWQITVPDKRVQVLSGIKPSTIPASTDVVIVNYDIVHSWLGALQALGPKMLVCDESHLIKEAKSRRSKAVKALAQGISYRLLLTGTPILNRPKELVHQLDVLGRLNAFGGAMAFLRRYTNAYQDRFGWNFDGAANLDELNKKLRQLCYVRRTKQEVLAELPAKVRARVMLPLANRAEYLRAKDSIVSYLRDAAARDKAFYASLGGLSKFEREERMKEHAQEAAVKASRAEQLVRIETLKRLAAQGKLTAACEWISDFLESGQKLIVFASHREIQQDILARFPGAAHIFGDDSLAERQKNVDRFQKDERCRLIVCSLKAAGVGITLTAASNVAFVELGWTPGEMTQAEDRAHRISQAADSVTCWYLLADKSIDVDIEALLAEKSKVVNAATDGGMVGEGGSILSELVQSLLD